MIQQNKQQPALFIIFNRKIYNSNVTIQIICIVFVLLFMRIHKSYFICSLPSLQ